MYFSKHKRSVLFDFDGVIIDSESTSFLAWREIFRRRGAELTPEAWRPFVGRSVGRSPEDLLSELTRQVWTDCRDEKREIHDLLTSELEARPGIVETIAELQVQSSRLFIVSNAAYDYILFHLGRLDLQDKFETIFSGEQAEGRISKLELYRQAATSAGIDQRYAIALEDSEPGARAAIDAGFSVLGFPNDVTRHHKLETLCQTVQYPMPLTARAILELTRT